MVDFAKENVIDVQRLAKRLDVSADTIRRWMRQGLEKVKVGGRVYTSLEAVNRFSQPVATPAEVDPALSQMFRELRDRGLAKDYTDGRQVEVAKSR